MVRLILVAVVRRCCLGVSGCAPSMAEAWMNALFESVMMMVGKLGGESSVAMVSARSSATFMLVYVVPYACGRA